MIELQGISVSQGDFQLENLSLTVPSGGEAVLMGGNGAGKTTVLEVICGLRKPSSGSVRLGGEDVTTSPPGSRGIGYVPQDRSLFPNLNVFENLAFALRVRGAERSVTRNRVNELAEQLGLTPLLSRDVRSLSGGESQRVAIGRAIVFEPSVLLLDEPTSALDENTRRQTIELLINLKSQLKMTTLHVTHRRDEAAQLADRIYELRRGDLHLIADSSEEESVAEET